MGSQRAPYVMGTSFVVNGTLSVTIVPEPF